MYIHFRKCHHFALNNFIPLCGINIHTQNVIEKQWNSTKSETIFATQIDNVIFNGFKERYEREKSLTCLRLISESYSEFGLQNKNNVKKIDVNAKPLFSDEICDISFKQKHEINKFITNKGSDESHSLFKYSIYKLYNLSFKSQIFSSLNNVQSFVINKRPYSSKPSSKSSSENIKNKPLSSTKLLKPLNKLESLQKLAQMQIHKNIRSCPLLNSQILNNVNSDKSVLSCDDVPIDVSYYPSVSAVLNTTMSPQSLAILEKWKREKIAVLGDDGFKQYQQNLLSRGRLLHHNIRMVLNGCDLSTLTMSENIEKLWKSLNHALSLVSDVKLCETPVSHPILCYKGIVDCVAHYKDRYVLIEWKTSEKLKPTLKHIYDNPLQAVAYLGAINSNDDCFKTNEILLIYAYEDGTDAQIHHLNNKLCDEYWKQWLHRLEEYWKIIIKQSSSGKL